MIENSINKYISISRYNHLKSLLNEIRFPYAIIKGEPLSFYAYGEYGKRQSEDVDFLISRRNITQLSNLLYTYGFKSLTLSRNERILSHGFSHQTSPFTKKIESGLLKIDVNYDILWGEYTGKRIDIDTFLENPVELTIYGTEVKTLPPLKAFIQLVLHHYKEMNSIYHLATHNCIKESMFRDIYYLLIHFVNDISINSLCEFCEHYSLYSIFYYVLYYTSQVFKSPILESYVNAMETVEGKNIINCYGLDDKERKEWKVDFQTRLTSQNLYALISNDLNEFDLEKLERGKHLFGQL